MKKLFAGLMLCSMLVLPIAVSAQISDQPTRIISGDPEIVSKTINTIVNWVFYILLIFAIFVIFWAAFTFLTAAGDPEKVAKARNLILYAIVAIVVAFLAEGIVFLVDEKVLR